MRPYRAVFRCIAGCPGEYPLDEVIYRCPQAARTCSRSHHDLDALKQRSAARVGEAVRRPLHAHPVAVRLGRVGQEGDGCSPHLRDENVVSMFEGGSQPVLGPALRRRTWGVEDLWIKLCGNSPHRVVQGPGHDRAGLDGQADDRRRQADPGGGLRLDRRHLGRAGRLRRRGRHPHAGHPAPRQGLDRPAGAAAGQRRHRAGHRRQLRRLHGAGPAAGRRGGRLPGQQHELAAPRGAEDGRHRDRAAVRLAACPTGSSSPAATWATSARWAPA